MERRKQIEKHLVLDLKAYEAFEHLTKFWAH